jgi:exodeoxyribonuclease VII large subunit
MPAVNAPVFTVAQVNRYVKRMLEDDSLLAGLFVTGELSNVHPHASGHLYFTLKDENAAISAVMFRSSAQNLAFKPQNGMKVILFARLSLYEKAGQYQLYAEHMEAAGIGNLQAAFLQLRDSLQKEGLFDEARKNPLPRYARCVALVTSPTGAAVRDMIRIIRQKNPTVKIVVVPVLVQGRDAAADIARGLREVNEWGGADVIILGRGGGSMEDLWAFNEEETARAIAASKIPVISAVGHETDFTIGDFAADLRAPTPTAGAEMVVFDRSETASQVLYLTGAISKAVVRQLAEKKNRLRALHKTLRNPLRLIYDTQAHITNLLTGINKAALVKLQAKKTRLASQTALLEKNSPYAAWKRGFALVLDDAGVNIVDAKKISPGDRLTLQWSTKRARVSVTEVEDEAGIGTGS